MKSIKNKNLLIVLLIFSFCIVLLTFSFYFVMFMIKNGKDVSLLEKKEEAAEERDPSGNPKKIFQTPIELINFVNNNFEMLPKPGYRALEPEDLLDKKRAWVYDLAVFFAYHLSNYGYDSFILSYNFIFNHNKHGTNTVAVFLDQEEINCIFTEGYEIIVKQYGASIENFFIEEERRKDILIYSFYIFSSDVRDFELKDEAWIIRREINHQ